MLEKGIASIGNPQDLIWGWGEKHSFDLRYEEYDKYNFSQELKEASWNNVFDVYFNGEEPFIQYTFFQILKDDIISIKEIKNYKVHKIKNRFKNTT